MRDGDGVEEMAEGGFLRRRMKQVPALERHFQESENSALDQISLLATTLIFCQICISLCTAEHIKEPAGEWVQKVPSNFLFLSFVTLLCVILPPLPLMSKCCTADENVALRCIIWPEMEMHC